MSDERQSDEGGQATDPEQRAFSGGPDLPPSDPDQPEDGNGELSRNGGDKSGDKAGGKPDEQENPHGEYPNLPGYGG